MGLAHRIEIKTIKLFSPQQYKIEQQYAHW